MHKKGEYRLLIIDDTVESKRGKHIEGSCKYIWSNKEHRTINALNIVSLNYADSHSTFQLDFSIKMNISQRKSHLNLLISYIIEVTHIIVRMKLLKVRTF